MSDVTPWIPVSIKPVRDGWYEYRGNDSHNRPPYRYYWAGNQWGIWWELEQWVRLTESHDDEWRGLKEPAT